jgi:hypothetical protein
MEIREALKRKIIVCHLKKILLVVKGEDVKRKINFSFI